MKDKKIKDKVITIKVDKDLIDAMNKFKETNAINWSLFLRMAIESKIKQ